LPPRHLPRRDIRQGEQIDGLFAVRERAVERQRDLLARDQPARVSAPSSSRARRNGRLRVDQGRTEAIDRALGAPRDERCRQNVRERRPRYRAVVATGAPKPTRELQAEFDDQLRKERGDDRRDAAPRP